MQVCVRCVGGTQHTQKKGERRTFVCVIGFSADGFRTRAVRVIRWRELGFGRPKGKSRVEQSTGENRSTLGAGLVSLSVVLVLGVLTVDYRIIVIPPNRKRVNPGNSGAWFQILCTMKSEKGDRKDANANQCNIGTGQS